MKDYYYLLGVARKCSREDIRRSYRLLSKALHPDKTDNDVYLEDRFKEITEAYRVLLSDEKRRDYDQSLLEYESGLKTNGASWMQNQAGSVTKGSSAGRFVVVFLMMILALVPLAVFQYNKIVSLEVQNSSLRGSLNELERKSVPAYTGKAQSPSMEKTKAVVKEAAKQPVPKPVPRRLVKFSCSNCKNYGIYFRNPKWDGSFLPNEPQMLSTISILNKTDSSIENLDIKWIVYDAKGIPLNSGELYFLYNLQLSNEKPLAPGIAKTVSVGFDIVKEGSNSLEFEILGYNQ